MQMSSAPNYLRKRYNDEELLEWKAKKVKLVRLEHAKINEINKARAKAKPLLSHKQIAANNPAKAKLLQREKLTNNGYEVVFKITSNAKNIKQLAKHLDYISRKGTLELLDSDLNTYISKSQLAYCIENYQNGYVIPNENENKKECRETYNMIFSMRDYDDCDSTSLKNAAFETIKQLYPNAHFTLAFHSDTDNPHCHICLKATNNDGSRIDIKKADCTKIRKTFADNLNKRGIYALATRKRDSIRGRQIANNITESIEPKTLHEHNAKPHYYRILNFGEAPYNNDNLNKPSYFVRYYTRKGDVTLWGQNLRQIVEDSKLQKGEYARIVRIGYELHPYSFDKKIKGKLYTISTARKVAKWDISILNRAEKECPKLPEVKIKTTITPKEIQQVEPTKLTHSTPKRYTKQEWSRYYANKKTKLTQNKQQRSENARNTSRTYTREEWARFNAGHNRAEFSRANKDRASREFKTRFYAARNAALHKSDSPAFRDSPKPYADMCPVSQSNVAHSQKFTKPTRDNNQVFLPSNAQHNLSSTTREESKKRNNDRTL